MRTQGTIGNVQFKLQGFCISNMANKYKLVHNMVSTTVYVTNMRELKAEISKLLNTIDEY